MGQHRSKKKFLYGISFIMASFLGFMFIFYLMGHSNLQSFDEIEDLQKQVSTLEVDSIGKQTVIEDLEKHVNAISLKNLVEEAQNVYTDEEKSRKEGLLWIDREKSMYVVTLGVLNGIEPGSHLAVYEKGKRIGQVIVDTPFDVISYVSPLKKSLQLKDNYYKVIVEK